MALNVARASSALVLGAAAASATACFLTASYDGLVIVSEAPTRPPAEEDPRPAAGGPMHIDATTPCEGACPPMAIVQMPGVADFAVDPSRDGTIFWMSHPLDGGGTTA